MALPALAAALPALTELLLDDNSLRSLGDELVGLSRLKKLSARSNRIAATDPFTGEQVMNGIVAPYIRTYSRGGLFFCLRNSNSTQAVAVRCVPGVFFYLFA